jgi:hypothetical protein
MGANVAEVVPASDASLHGARKRSGIALELHERGIHAP